MPSASVTVDTSATRGANLRAISRQLAAMTDTKVKGIFRDRLEPVARTFVPAVRASALAIPVIPEGRQTGLRARIAACAEVASWDSGARQVSVAVEIQPERMPPGQKSLPLGMEGAKRWRHPVFGNRENWVQQPPHPFFYQAAGGFGRAAGAAMQAALDDITRDLNG